MFRLCDNLEDHMKKYIYILIVFSIVSCERELTLDSSNFEKQIVVNSTLSADSTFTVDLAYSRFITDTNTEYVDDAQVSIMDLTSNRSYALINSGDGRYINPNVAIKSHDYKLSVMSNYNQHLTGYTCIPQDLMVDISVDTIYDNNFFINELNIGVEIANDPNSDNFYSFELLPYLKRVVDLDSIYDNTPIVDFVSNSLPQFTDASSTDLFKNLNIFSDKEFEGKDVSTSFSFGREDISFGDNEESDRSESNNNTSEVNVNGIKYVQAYAVRIMAVSPELFDYMQSYEIYNQQSSINSSNSQPSKIEFNIENGLGVFGGTNIQIIPIN